MEAHKQVEMEIMYRKQVVVDYDQPLYPRVLPRNIRELSDDVLKVYIPEKKTGKWVVDIGLVFIGQKLGHVEAENILAQEKTLSLAGIHESMALLPLLHELPFDKFRFTALKERMVERAVEFIFTVHGSKRTAYAVMDFRDCLPFKNRLFVVQFGESQKLI